MSGGGGFYKYRCKFFYSHDCPNWVFVNYAPCAACCAAGRDDDELPARRHARLPRDAGSPDDDAAGSSFEIAVPLLRAGVLRYARTPVAIYAVPGAAFVSWRFPGDKEARRQPNGYENHRHRHTPPLRSMDIDDDLALGIVNAPRSGSLAGYAGLRY